MLTRSRDGFTLAEVLIALALTLVVAGALWGLLFDTQRVARDQAQRVNLQSNLRTGSLVILSELRELSAVAGGTGVQNDVLAAGTSAMTYRAMRGIGFTCAGPTAGVIRLGRSTFTGHRDPQAGRDEALILLPDTGGSGAADSWLSAPISAVATSSACPGSLGPGISLTLPAGTAVAGLEVGTPVRIAEVMELRLYVSEGRSWLGARSVSTGEAVQPLLGPLTSGSGFRLEYLDAGGAPTADRTRISAIRVALRGSTDGGGGSTPVDEELIAQAGLRNAVQP
jgi:prepilin-type N-terminal cleavage/methylation domain-containing protein